MLNNFFFRIRQWASDHRTKLIKVALVVLASLILAWLILYAIERIQQAGYEKGVHALEIKALEASERAKELEGQANVLKIALSGKYAELVAIRERAETAEMNLQNARRATAPLKVIYEQAHNAPDIPIDISDCGACAELARAGHSCK